MKSVTNNARASLVLGGACILLVLALLPLSGSLLSRARINSTYVSLNKALNAGEQPDLEVLLAELYNLTTYSPDLREAWRGAALLNMALGRRDAATNAWARVDGYEQELVAWGTRAERTEDWIEAREWYLVAVTLAPRNGDNSYRLASVSAQMGDSQAVEYYLQALSAPERTEFGRSNILTRLGELEKRNSPVVWSDVRARFDEAIEQDDFVDQRDVIQAWLGKAEALERVGQPGDALAAYEWVAAARPGHYWANVHSGRLAWQVDSDAVRAIAYLERAAAIDDKSKWAFLNLGLVNAQSGDPTAAIAAFRKALAIDPDDTTAGNQLERLTGGDGY